MRRRRSLHVASAVGCSALAGCSIPGQTTDLRNPERTDAERGADWTFHDGGERLLSIALEYASPLESGLVPLTFHTWHRDDTHLGRFRVKLQFRQRAGEVPPDVYLDAFDSSPDPKLDFHDDDGTTVLDVPDLGSVGRGSIGVNFLVRPHGWLPNEIGVGIREVLTESGPLGGKYAAEVNDRMSFASGQ